MTNSEIAEKIPQGILENILILFCNLQKEYEDYRKSHSHMESAILYNSRMAIRALHIQGILK
jgi:hypothetical protein